MDSWTEKRELVRVAKLYYMKGLTQADIAKKIGVSRPIISKLLQRAKEMGIVEIIIKDETVSMVELEQQLESRYSLDEAIVVPVAEGDGPELVKQVVAKTAALHLSKLIRDVKRVGISWGTTLYHLVQEFPYHRDTDVKVLPLVGGIGRNRIEIHANQLAYELSKKLGGTCEFLYAPAIAETVELKQQLLESSEIHALLDEASRVDLAVVGVGVPYESTMVEMGYLKKAEIEDLKRFGAIGDISSRFIDYRGEEIDFPLNKRVIGIDLADLRRIPTVIGVVSGINKAEAIRGVLNGGYFHKLVVDEQTAKELIHADHGGACHD
ncbi:sugar-binding transcriptional regulator [Brevibacillus humidisoli]|uniref:sugar-binding transcriptional regulator n=1 Tax=Brevibacillus humidisoli TaxID=2895522 RepID=UPI001E5B7C69|nr:sugar-binding transcriptional regulator [Brevibacillus humidisoli]UFJ42362.1 sugar-binding transcriptional regulator [Brevibacillus humidisoli]